MNQEVAAFTTLRALKGAPLSILIALFVARKPVSQEFLCTRLGYTDKTVRRALDLLCYEGYIERTGYREWQLPGGQMPLPGFDTYLLDGQPAGYLDAEIVDNSDPEPAQVGEIPMSDQKSAPLGDIDPVDVDEISPNDAPQPSADADSEPVLGPETGKIFSPLTTTTVKSSNPQGKSSSSTRNPQHETGKNFPDPVPIALQEAFHVAKIAPHVWPELAALAHVTPGYVRAHAIAVENHQNPDYRNTGFLIHVLRSGDPAPDVCEECHGLNGDHDAMCHKRYSSGKWSHLFET